MKTSLLTGIWDVQCADLMPVSLAILQEKSTHRYHRYPSSFAGGLGAMAPYDASEEVAPPFQSLYFSNVPWQVARYHQNLRDEIFWVWGQPKDGGFFKTRIKVIKVWKVSLQGTCISHLKKRKIIFKYTLGGDMLVPKRVHQKLLPVKTRLQVKPWGVHEQVRAIGYGQSKVKGRQEWQGSSEDVRWALPHVQELCDLVHLFQLYRCTIYRRNGVKRWDVAADFKGFPFPSRKHLAGNVGKYVAVFDAGQLNIAYPSKVTSKFIQRPRSCMECRIWLMIDDFALILNHIMPVFCKDKVFAFDHGSTSKRSDHGNILWKFVGSRHVPSTPSTFILDCNYWSHSACVRPKRLKKLGLSRYSALTTIIS